jgi:MarR family transcriptional regulator, 2-MHQ and catechol-resistance regulon repressor
MPTKYSGTKSEVRALNAYIKLLRASESITGRLAGLVSSQTGMTLSQFSVLEALLHLGPMCQKEIAEKQLKSGGNMTLVIDNLEKRGLVRRERSQADRRLIIVHLTKPGNKLIEDYFPRHAQAIEHEMGALTAKEQDQLAVLARKLGLQIGRAG